MLRIAICDDDSDFIKTFTQLVTSSFAKAGQESLILSFTDGKKLINKMEKDKQIFDIIFLDVEMPEIGGFQVAQRLRDSCKPCILIFTTYMEHQSREGYLYGAFRYIFKNNLAVELEEAIESINKKMKAAAGGEDEITFRGRVAGVLENITLRKADIIFLKAEKTRQVTLKTRYADYDLIAKPLSEYAELLNSSAFVPIMRNYLLNFNTVEAIEDDSFLLTSGINVPLGIRREVRKASMEKYLKFLEERI